MASYQARGRDPLFDSNTALALEKRSKELAGLGLILVGLLLGLAFGTFNHSDPSFFAATDAPVQNWLGGLGATISAFGLVVLGLGVWALVAGFVTWGMRLVLHRADMGIFLSLILAPVWVLLCSAYAAGLDQTPSWSETAGMGGLIGDVILGLMVKLMPFSLGVGLKLSQLILALAIFALGCFVLGFNRSELRSVGRFMLVGVVMVYATLVSLVGRGASGAVGAAQRAKAAKAERIAERTAAQDDVVAYGDAPAVPAAPLVQRASYEAEAPDLVDDEDFEDEPAPAKQGFLSRMPSLIRRPEPMPEPELVDHFVDHDVDAPEDDRIRAKIADAVKTRRRASPVAARPMEDPNKPLTKGRGHGPAPLIFKPKSDLPAEPPLTSGLSDLPPAPSLTAFKPTLADLPPAPDFAGDDSGDAYTELRDFDDYGVDHFAPMSELDAESTSETEPEHRSDFAPEYVSDFDPVPEQDAPHELASLPEIDDPIPPLDDADDEVQSFAPAPVAAPVVPIHRGGVVPAPEPKKVVQQPQRKPILPSRRAKEEAQPKLQFDEASNEFELPPLGLLMSPDSIERHVLSDEALEENARMLETVLDDYGVKGEIVSVRPGPVVTMYELEPAPGLKASRVIGLADDIARSMSALSARVSTVPGRSVIGIELPNEKREMVSFREIMSGRDYGDGNHKLPLALGKDIGGDPVVANLAKMPHLLIAGTTGSGKSVAINTMILSLLYKLTPDECRLIMIDPKMLELSVYDGIPHLLSPVVTDPKKAVVALKWTVGEMEDRYRKMSKMGVRNIDGYNSRVKDALDKGEMFSRTVQTGFDDETGEPVFETEEFEPKKMPYIVVIVDEMADLMMVAGKEIEACIQRLAQMARASGIHLIMATQRPSVDVITGTIKANFPTRISFQVTSKIDSRTILGEMGAEQLLGMGDMLYMAGGAKITRCHGPFVSDEEVEEIVNHLKAFGPPEYVSGVVAGPDDEKASNIDAVLGLNTGGNTNGEDALYDQAVAIVIKDRKCSTSYIQRKLGIGYNKAARLVEQMEDEHVVSSANHVGKREILVPEQ
ncbi:MAG: DNA translocase FtsK 4TM domain-containing protein [Pelagimonas sp.]